jgi:putative transcriptional regulator
MTHGQVRAAAMNDPDICPMMDAEWDAAPKMPRSKTLRRVLGLTQEEFAARYQVPLGTLRDWEQAKTEPDQSARTYLKAIAGDPVYPGPAGAARNHARKLLRRCRRIHADARG